MANEKDRSAPEHCNALPRFAGKGLGVMGVKDFWASDGRVWPRLQGLGFRTGVLGLGADHTGWTAHHQKMRVFKAVVGAC